MDRRTHAADRSDKEDQRLRGRPRARRPTSTACKLDGIAAPFLKRATLEGSGDRARWTLLADATVFDLPDDRLRLRRSPFDAGDVSLSAVTWDDRSSARVTRVERRARATPRFGRGAGAAAASARSIPQTRERAGQEPLSHRPSRSASADRSDRARASRTATSSATATVTEPRLGNGEVLPTTLGSGTVRRAERGARWPRRWPSPIDSARRDASSISSSTTATTRRLRSRQSVARFEKQPWIYFESPSATALTARYGDPRLNAPRYDIEASRRFLESAKPATATWGKAEAAKLTETTESDPAASLQGAAVDRGAFRVSAPVAQRAGRTDGAAPRCRRAGAAAASWPTCAS